MRTALREAWLWGAVFALGCAALAAGSGFDLDPFDSAELALVAVTRGLGHPPGQPLHTVLGWLATRGPWRPLAALAWLSIAPTAGMFALGTREALAPAGDADPSEARPRDAWVRGVGVVAAGLAPCVLGVVRTASTRVEVYGLAAVLSVAAVFVARRGTTRSALGAGVLVGLAGATNPVVAAQAVGVAWIAPGARAGTRERAQALGALGLGALLGLGAYVYAWAVAPRVGATMVWSAPRDASTLWAELTARDFQRNVSLSAGTLARNELALAWDLARGGVLPYLALGAWGLARARRTSAWLALIAATGVGMLMVGANVPYRGNNPDYGGYVLVPVALASEGCVRWFAAHTGGLRARVAAAVALAGVLVLALASGALQRRPSGATRALASAVLAGAPRGAIVVLRSDHLLFPALYLQGVEHVRTDVTVLNPGWASSSWAWRWAMTRDRALVVDLTPGVGGATRLANALRARAPGRTVLSESLAVLASATQGGICPRGVGWSSPEGCAPGQAGSDAARAVLRREAERAARGSWDERLVLYTAGELATDALALGCPGLAARYLSSGLAVPVPEWARARACDRRAITPGGELDLLTVSRDDATRALSALAP